MRTKIFLVAALVALGFAACNTEDVPYFSGEEGAPATITVTLFTAPTTRSADGGNVGDPGGLTGTPEERAIHTLQVFLFENNGNGAFVTSKFFKGRSTIEGVGLYQTGDGTYIANNIETTTGSRTMIVIANHPEITREPTRDDLINEIADVELVQDISTTGLVMTSEMVVISLVRGENFWGIRPGGNLESYRHHNPTENLQLNRINARVALTDVRFNNHTPDTRFDRFELQEVAMFNVRDGSRLFGRTSNGNNTFDFNGSLVREDALFLFGADFPSPNESFRRGTLNEGLLIDWTNVPWDSRRSNPDNGGRITGLHSTNAMFFYVFENAGDRLVNVYCNSVSVPKVIGRERENNTGTFIVLKGQLFLGYELFIDSDRIYTCQDGFTYYAIWVNCKEVGTVSGQGDHIGDNSIRRNRQYNISVNLWGPGHSTIDPANYLDVHVEVTRWIPVTQEVDWGTRPNQRDAGVVISGVRWATRNVAAAGTFANNPHDTGMLFQWGSNIAWLPVAGDEPVSVSAGASWLTNKKLEHIISWNNNRGPCPPGWRLPTQAELESLKGAESVWREQNNVWGRLFGTAPNTIFLPAVGFRDNMEKGIFSYAGIEGRYWSSAGVAETYEAHYLRFRDDWHTNERLLRANGLSVRCVHALIQN